MDDDHMEDTDQMAALIQQQLLLLLHAHKCNQLEDNLSDQLISDNRCPLRHCPTMKTVLAHMSTCHTTENPCNFPHCTSSKRIIIHWKSCLRPDCPVCIPLCQFDHKIRNDKGIPVEPLDELKDLACQLQCIQL